MRTRIAVITGIVAVVVLVAAGAVYAFDSAHKDKIAEGVTVDGIDVGGMTPAQASAKLKAELVDPLNKPVIVKTGDGRFRLTPGRRGSPSTSTARWTRHSSARATATCWSARGASCAERRSMPP